MCGRYAASAEIEQIVDDFEIELDRTGAASRSILVNPQTPAPGTPDWNMAPSKQAPVVLSRVPRRRERAEGIRGSEGMGGAHDGEREQHVDRPARQVRLLTWGLVPSWAKDARGGVRMINARAESVLSKPAYSRAAAARRCLVPATGWYEWQKSPTATDAQGKPRKQPFFIRRGDDQTCAFAGLYEFWRDPAVADGDDPLAWLTTFTIITTEAEPGLDRIHDRQPLVLERRDWARWLDPQSTDVGARSDIAQLLAFTEPGRFAAHPVSRAVGAASANGPGLLAPLDASELVGVVDPESGEIIGAAS